MTRSLIQRLSSRLRNLGVQPFSTSAGELGKCIGGTQRLKSRLRNAKLRHGQASIEDVDYGTPRRLDKALFQQLAASR
jgi:hypothetical protein